MCQHLLLSLWELAGSCHSEQSGGNTDFSVLHLMGLGAWMHSSELGARGNPLEQGVSGKKDREEQRQMWEM
jgi:hypothetical protein